MDYGQGSCIYEGSWKDGKRSGHGRLVHKDEGTYEGEWGNDLQEGKGTMTYISGKEKLFFSFFSI